MTLVFEPMHMYTPYALGVYSRNYQGDTAPGQKIKYNTLVRPLPYNEGDGYTVAMDQWAAAQQAAAVLGGGKVGLCVYVNKGWYDTDDGALLTTQAALEEARLKKELDNATKMAQLKEGHYTVTKIFSDEDCDHGVCIGYEVAELNLIVYHYPYDPTRISFHFLTGTPTQQKETTHD